MGYELTQSLSVGRNTLLVERPDNILYLQSLSVALRMHERRELDPRWTMCPAGRIDKTRPFVSLPAVNGIDVAVLSDMARGDKRKVDDINRSSVMKAGHLHTMADLLKRSKADIEDVFKP